MVYSRSSNVCLCTVQREWSTIQLKLKKQPLNCGSTFRWRKSIDFNRCFRPNIHFLRVVIFVWIVFSPIKFLNILPCISIRLEITWTLFNEKKKGKKNFSKKTTVICFRPLYHWMVVYNFAVFLFHVWKSRLLKFDSVNEHWH